MMDSDIPAFGAVFCIIMIIIGQFFLMNLILAVIIFAFIRTQKAELEGEITALKEEPNTEQNITHHKPIA